MSKRKATAITPEQLAQRAAYSKLLECVRIYLDEHLPDDAVLAEKCMFGMDMFMVRGNMFMGVGVRANADFVSKDLSPKPLACAELVALHDVLFFVVVAVVAVVALHACSVRARDCWFESAKRRSRRRSQNKLLA